MAAVSAWDLGYLSTSECLVQLDRTFDTLQKLPRYRGHLFNWYDTQSLVPLAPLYVSTVDSGNLLGYLMTLKRDAAGHGRGEPPVTDAGSGEASPTRSTVSSETATPGSRAWAGRAPASSALIFAGCTRGSSSHPSMLEGLERVAAIDLRRPRRSSPRGSTTRRSGCRPAMPRSHRPPGGSMPPPPMVAERQRELAAFAKTPDEVAQSSREERDDAHPGRRRSVRRRHRAGLSLRSSTASVRHRLQRHRGTPRLDFLRRAGVGGPAGELHRDCHATRVAGALVQARTPDDAGRPLPRAGVVERLDVRVPDAAPRSCAPIRARC